MREYRFLAPAQLFINGKWLSVQRFGQAQTLDDAAAKMAAKNRSTFLSAEAFNAIGFTVDELRRYASISSHGNASPEFLDKKDRAIEAAKAELAALNPQQEVTAING
jgi:multidrug resistance efflux pump